MVPGSDAMRGSYLGPEFPADEIRAFLDHHGYAVRRAGRRGVGADASRALLAGEKVVGLCQGRMEFGPRALGGRSILGDPRSPAMQSVMNLKIKYRESFRPFAPSVLRERVADYFELDAESPYMLLVADVRRAAGASPSAATSATCRLVEWVNRPRSDLPAITHVDYSARIQTVAREHESRATTRSSRRSSGLTGCAVLVNTSFNVRGEPIVCTPEDAYRCFMRTEMDYLVLGPFLLDKATQPAFADRGDWQREYGLELDMRSTSSSRCDEKITVRPSSATVRTMASRMSRCTATSRPEEGSSRISSSGRWATAAIRPAWARMPFDSSLISWMD